MLPLQRLQVLAHFTLRVGAGGLFLFHGAQKLLGWLTTKAPPDAGSQLWWGGLIELLGGALVVLGLATRPAALLAAGTMAVAYAQFHWKFALTSPRLFPIVNGGELAVLYGLVFFFLFAHGPGPWSLDARRRAAPKASDAARP